MSKVVAIIQSPRKESNGSSIVKKIVEVARTNGNNVETFYISDNDDINGCQACMGCKKAGKCIKKDNLTPILDAIASCDGLVISTPDYFGQPCSQYRTLEDRFYGFLGPNFELNIKPNKKVQVIVTCAGGLDGAKSIADSMTKRMVDYFKCKSIGSIVFSEQQSGCAANCPEALDEAQKIGQRL